MALENTKIIFGKFGIAANDITFGDIFRNEKTFCWEFLIRYNNNKQCYLKNDNTDAMVKKNCRLLDKYLKNMCLFKQNDKTCKLYQKNCKKLNISDNIPTLVYDDIYWLFSSNPKSKLGGISGSAGKWMLFCNKKILTHSYNKLKKELISFKYIDKPLNNNDINDNDQIDEKKNNDNNNNNDILLTELDYYWIKVDKLVMMNKLGFAAKVSTNTDNNRRNELNGVIIVYTKDVNDTDKVLKVAQNIRNFVGFTQPCIRYKTDQQTRRGVYSKNGQKAHVYRHVMSDFNTLQM